MGKEESSFCPYPHCNATALVTVYKESVDGLKRDLKDDFNSLHTNQSEILASIRAQGAIQTEITTIVNNLDKLFVENAEIFNRLRAVENTVSVNSNRLGSLETKDSKSTKWVWDIAKLLIVAAIVAVATHLMMGSKYLP